MLSQRKDPDHYPEITTLAQLFSNFRLYREWSFGRRAPPRVRQKTDVLGDFLAEDGHNLALVLNGLKRHADAYRSILDHLRDFYEQVESIDTIVDGGKLQVYFYERGLRSPLPATRLSDGTLRSGGTTMRRLDRDRLRGWPEEYRLGELWRKGELGGTRW